MAFDIDAHLGHLPDHIRTALKPLFEFADASTDAHTDINLSLFVVANFQRTDEVQSSVGHLIGNSKKEDMADTAVHALKVATTAVGEMLRAASKAEDSSLMAHIMGRMCQIQLEEDLMPIAASLMMFGGARKLEDSDDD